MFRLGGLPRIIILSILSKIMLCSKSEELWHFVLISKIKKTKRPFWHTIEANHDVFIYLLSWFSISEIVAICIQTSLQVEFINSLHLFKSCCDISVFRGNYSLNLILDIFPRFLSPSIKSLLPELRIVESYDREESLPVAFFTFLDIIKHHK